MRQRVVTGRTVYEDTRLTLSSAAITIRGYWLPFGITRSIRLDALAKTTLHDRGDATYARWPRWGRGGAPGTWFPFDSSRPRRGVAVALHLSSGKCVVTTPANPTRLASLLSELVVPGEAPAVSAD